MVNFVILASREYIKTEIEADMKERIVRAKINIDIFDTYQNGFLILIRVPGEREFWDIL